MRNRYISGLAGFVFAVTMLGFGQAEPDPWRIVTSGGKGPLNLHTTHEDLVRAFGAANIVEQDGIEGFSGEMEYVTVIFPKDPQRSIEIRWRDADKKTVPESMTIRGRKSRWKAEHGISLGTSLNELERLNGRPFRLTGFYWDYSGTVTSWDKGVLEEDLQAPGRVVLRLSEATETKLSEKESREVAGDGEFSSSHPVMQKANPKVYEIVWAFP
jgi:hypothetical protein